MFSSDVEYTFKDVGLKQNIPVLGLYPNYNNQITLIYTDLQGNERARYNPVLHHDMTKIQIS